jgi:vitamin B12 transporter
MMKKLINLNLGLFLVPFFAIPSVNAEEIKDLENIIVTESRIPTIVSESLSAISVITREDIERYQASDLYDLMSRLPGVSMLRNGVRGSATSLSIRGNQGDHSLFLVDGVRMGSASLGSATLGLINTNSIERIEVVRGPKSNLYGADAIGGVVNIITRDATDMDSLQIKSSIGSNGTNETTLSAGTTQGKSSFSAVFNSYKTDGIDSTYDISPLQGDEDGHENDSISLRYGYKINDDAKLSFSYSNSDSSTDYDTACGDSVSYLPVDCDIFTKAAISSLSSSLVFQLNEHWNSNFKIGRSTDNSEEFARNIDINSTYNAGTYDTTKTEATWLNVIELKADSLLSLGLDYQKDEIDSSVNYDVTSRDNKAAFLQYKLKSDGADVSFGARRDDNEQFGAHTTTSVMAGQNVSDNIRLNFSYGEGFKPPSFNDLYWPNSGNANLMPEQSKNYELGLKANWNNSSLNVGLFNNSVENIILWYSHPTDWTLSGNKNIDNVEISGLEFSLNTQAANWMLGLSGTVMKPEDKSSGNILVRRAERSASLDGDYSVGNYGLGFTVYSQSHTFDDTANTVRLGGFTTLALRANFDLSENWKVKVNANNLTDKEYVTARGYRSMGRELLFTLAYTPSF